MVVQIIRTTGREKKQAEREGESLQGNVTRGRGAMWFCGGEGGEREREKREGGKTFAVIMKTTRRTDRHA